MPLSTAPSLTPEALVLLVGALWGARLGRNRHLARTTEDRLMTVIGGETAVRDTKHVVSAHVLLLEKRFTAGLLNYCSSLVPSPR